MITAAPVARSVDIPPTLSTGVSATHIITQSHSHRPDPTHLLHSQKQAKAPVGLIVGVALAVIAALFGLFFVRYLFVRRKKRRDPFAWKGTGKTVGATAGAVAAGAESTAPDAPIQTSKEI
ncbi:hypothetical protein MSAN_01585500 [Mycena sanguinolenta]|uniref:Uncharacterized protein n=1 Tax=Mycena sanguinolenta TaxID=230812 RepID=A0A8H6Y3Z2_9AGAR|nr:hypothetical protein MSAN_01585500 [Mycena sanguinolenta]